MKLESDELRILIAQQHRTKSLPPRFKEGNFRRFEENIRAICRNYPQATSFIPNDLRCETFVCRLRDAITVYMNFDGYKSDIQRARIREIFSGADSFVIRHDGKVVVVGPPKKLKLQSADAATPVEATAPSTIDYTEPPTLAELTSLITFLLRQPSFTPITFPAPLYPIPDIPGDIVIRHQNNKWTII